MTSGSRSVAGRVALVTGTASGMGKAIAALLRAEGAVVADLDRPGTGATFECDLGDRSGIGPVVAAVRQQCGPVDILVNNAGVSRPAALDAEDFEACWDEVMAVNLTAPALLIRACAADLCRNGDGRVVNIASTEGLGATRGIAAYTASKHGLVGLTRSMAMELGRRGATVNCICPGSIHTGMTAVIPPEHRERFARRRVPLGRYGEPEEIAHMVLSLVLPAASYTNGAILAVDGGLIVQNT
jgi:3-oxoacyl-[acyl-carrier protein] reductase